MPQPSTNVVMADDTPFNVTRNEKITLTVEQGTTLQTRKTGGTTWTTHTNAALPVGVFDFDGIDGQFQVTSSVGGENYFSRSPVPQA